MPMKNGKENQMATNKNKNTDNRLAIGISLGLSFGTSIGLVVGEIFENPMLGLSFGPGIGLLLGLIAARLTQGRGD